MNTELEIKNESLLTMQGFLNIPKVKTYLENILKERTGQFITSLVSLSNLTPGLTQCEPRSLMMCGLKAASLNLPLDNNLGFAYAIPYKNNEKKITEAQFQIGAKGFVQLGLRTGQYTKLNVLPIKEGELQKWDPLTEELILKIIPDTVQRERTATIGYAAMFELINGFKKIIYWSKEKVLAHGKRFSKMYDRSKGQWRYGSIWESDEDAMSTKTLIKYLLSKWGPLSTEIIEAVKFDQAVIRESFTGEEQPDYVDHTDTPQIESPTYDIPEKDLAFIEDCFNILNINQAERAMKLAGCKGKVEEITKLIAELKEKIIQKGKSIEENVKVTKGMSPHADEVFGKSTMKKDTGKVY